MAVRRLEGDRLVLATHNERKVAEFRSILQPFAITVQTCADLNLVEPSESEDTFAGNARIKAHTAARATGIPAVADDSGIEVEALGGKPGVHTADWAGTPTRRDYELAMTRVWNMLENLNAPYPRTARFCSTICLAWPDGHDEIFTGTIRGQIVWPMRGSIGFGFDPVFMPDGYCRTFGEMEPEHKNAISHRALSLKQFCESCLNV